MFERIVKRTTALILVSLIVIGCQKPEVTPTATTVSPTHPAPTPTLARTIVTSPPQSTETAVPATATFIPSSTPAATTTRVAETATAVSPPEPTALPIGAPEPALPGAVSAVRKPLLIDGAKGRIYASAQVNAEPKTVVLSTVDGRLLAAYDTVGELALDRTNNRLIVDQGTAGLAILDAQTGALLSTVMLPQIEDNAAPQVDPTTGLVYAFRDNVVYVIDPTTSAAIQTFESNIEGSSCGEPAGISSIWRSQYDLVNQKLYLTFITYTCTPWVSVSVVVYDAGTLTELGRHTIEASYQAVPYQGSLYGATAPRMGPSRYWAWNNDVEWYAQSGKGHESLRGIVADWGRQLVYEALGKRIQITDVATRAPLGQVEVELLADGSLVGHDPITDHLYFLTGTGRLHIWPTSHLFDQTSTTPESAPSTLPARPVRALAISPGWPADPTIAGLWDNGDCPVDGGQLYLQGKEGWQLAPINGDGRCDAVAAVALSPNYPLDHTLLVTSNDLNTVLKSTDGGQSWQAAETAFPADHHFKALFISSNYAQDQTLFAHLATGAIYKSQDGGRTWQTLNWSFDQLAISLEFGIEDRTLMGAVGSELYLSPDGGDNWRLIGDIPDNNRLVMLSMAPLFGQWQVAFAFSAEGRFYRSLDGGFSWEYKMEAADTESAQIVYAPGLEANRPVFLLHGRSLDNSYDGWESSWGARPRFEIYPAHITTLAISPNYVNDGLLLVGTADGQVVSGDASRPVYAP